MDPVDTLFNQKLKPVDFNLIRKEVYDYCGIKITPVKKQMVEGRLRRRLKALGMHSYDDYCDFVFRKRDQHDDDEFIHLVDAITTNKTEFFREPVHFSYLSSQVVPKFLKRASGGNTPVFRIWSAACSTGQEPYSMAMELAEYARLQQTFLFQVYGTDICTKVLETAKKAVYNFDDAVSIPSGLKQRYLLKSKKSSSNLVRVVPELRKKVSLRRLNLKDRDFGVKGKMDVIFCRNVIIYFDTKTQEDILRRLALCLRKGGYLFLGHSESIHGMELPIKPVAPTIYERI
jgi:chemotaxis protein methyltransferase CheR